MRISDRSSDVCSSDLFFDRVEAPASAQQKKTLAKLSPGQLKADKLAGTTIREVLDKAPGNDAPIGGIKVVADSGWFAARPSGTADIYKLYGERFESRDNLQAILAAAPGIVDAALERPYTVPYDRKST